LSSNHRARPFRVFEGISTQRLDSGLEVKEAHPHLYFLGELGRGTEFLHKSVHQVLATTRIGGQHTGQKIDAFLTSGLGKRKESIPGSRHSTINVSRIA